VSVAPYLTGPWWSRFLHGQLVVDESWAIAAEGDGRFNTRVLLGAGLTLYVAWVVGTTIGALFGNLIGDPDTWYAGKYAADPKYGTREQHYQMWENMLNEYPNVPWIGAHMGGNPENLSRLQGFLDRHPNLSLDRSATKWIARALSTQRNAARDFFIRNQDRLIFGSDQVSNDERGYDFYCSRFWVQRKMWETAYIGPSPIQDSDAPADAQPTLRGLALPDGVLQKLYHDNAVRYLASVGISTDFLHHG
jgi:hypothetical protein